MAKRTSKLLICILLLSAGGCGETPLDPDKNLAEPEPQETEDWVQDYLAGLWAASDHDDWDVISGTIDPLAGGVISGVPDSWPAGFVFSVVIPPKAIASVLVEDEPQIFQDKSRALGYVEVGNDRIRHELVTPPLQISIHVPRYHPGVPGNYGYPAVYKLEPHGLEFIRPVTVTFCQPPWRPASPQYHKFHFWREGTDPDWTYYYSDHELLSPQGTNPRTDLVFETLHFSRWGMENGSGGGSGKSLPAGPR